MKPRELNTSKPGVVLVATSVLIGSGKLRAQVQRLATSLQRLRA
jgi:hypothetical protein